ncbi:hypothetical protein PVAND_002141 [Polypedilum vanderplanki]|uniref:Serine/threonine-protein kinase ULK3 n=1 Tax=Polypedilum vanderplanki TaxID=319348 RepID=A0A9J6BQ27_POLVA|nr:hypothetical protein PVAND_002141 [Polypedilum vanderplanki]
MAKISDYELLQQIGSGSYAIVHKAINKKTREFCAIKVMERKKFLEKNRMQQLIDEIAILKKLEHRYIVKMLDFGWDNQNIYIITELCDTSLHCVIKKRPLREKSVRLYIRMLAEALKYLRENNISHFDLKPHNILLKREKCSSLYVLKVADFGFASMVEDELEEQSILKGSYLYMAPEIVNYRTYNAKADLWSIGCILYECLFGRAPYSSQTIEELLEKIQNCQKIDIPSNIKISPECEDLLSRLLKHDPEERITFQDFFNHDFVDMKHSPNDENMERAIQIMTRAVEEDKKQNYQQAYYLYCEGLTYFVPLIDAEIGPKKAALREKASNYLRRAEEIKHSILYQSARISNNTLPSSTINTVQKALEPSQLYKTLYDKCYSNEQLRNGLEIGISAEYYAYEKKFETSLETYKRCLSILVPLLNKEQDIERKKLLHKQIEQWMKEAESIKSILETQKNIVETSADEKNSNSHCVIS